MATVPSQSTKDVPLKPLPPVSRWLINRFDWYLQRYFPKHFHAFAANNVSVAGNISQSAPLIVYMNHASWWDPLVALVVSKKYFPHRLLFAPIDAVAVRKYPFMQRLGFFPVEQDRLRGAGEFLKTARSILQHPGTSIWITPEGQFADPRQRDLGFQPGLAHLVSKLPSAVVLPLAIEYPFWEERLPEVLVRFGEPIVVSHASSNDAESNKETWGARLESALRQTQSDLETLSLARNSDAFEIVMSGKTGVSWLYDSLRRCSAFLTGKKLDKSHGSKLQ